MNAVTDTNYEWLEDDPNVEYIRCPHCRFVRPCKVVNNALICKPCLGNTQEANR